MQEVSQDKNLIQQFKSQLQKSINQRNKGNYLQAIAQLTPLIKITQYKSREYQVEIKSLSKTWQKEWILNHISHATQCISEDNFKDSVNYLETIIDFASSLKDPTTHSKESLLKARCLLATYLQTSGHIEQALNILKENQAMGFEKEEIQQFFSIIIEANRLQASLLMRVKQFKRAQTLLIESIKLLNALEKKHDPFLHLIIECLKELGQLYFQLKHFEKAIIRFKQSIQFIKQLPVSLENSKLMIDTRLELVDVYGKNGELKKAIALLQQIGHKTKEKKALNVYDPSLLQKNVTYLNSLGQYYLSKNLREDALNCFKKSSKLSELQPELTAAYQAANLNKIRIYRSVKSFEKASRLAKEIFPLLKSQELKSEIASIWFECQYQQAIKFKNKGEYRIANHLFESSLEIANLIENFALPHAFYNSFHTSLIFEADSERINGSYALQLLDKVKSHPKVTLINQAKSCNLAGQIYLSQGKHFKAFETFSNALNMYQSISSPSEICQILTHYSHALLLSNSQDVDLESMMNALQFCQSTNLSDSSLKNLLNSYLNVSRYYIKFKDIEKSHAILEEGLNQLSKVNEPLSAELEPLNIAYLQQQFQLLKEPWSYEKKVHLGNTLLKQCQTDEGIHQNILIQTLNQLSHLSLKESKFKEALLYLRKTLSQNLTQSQEFSTFNKLIEVQFDWAEESFINHKYPFAKQLYQEIIGNQNIFQLNHTEKVQHSNQALMDKMVAKVCESYRKIILIQLILDEKQHILEVLKQGISFASQPFSQQSKWADWLLLKWVKDLYEYKFTNLEYVKPGEILLLNDTFALIFVTPIILKKKIYQSLMNMVNPVLKWPEITQVDKNVLDPILIIYEQLFQKIKPISQALHLNQIDIQEMANRLLKIYLKYSKIYSQETEEYLKKALQIYQKYELDANDTLTTVYTEIGNYYWSSNQLNKAQHNWKQAMESCKSKTDEEPYQYLITAYIKLLYMQGNDILTQKKYQLAREKFEEGLKLSSEIHVENDDILNLKFKILSELINLEQSQLNFLQALDYLTASIELAPKVNDLELLNLTELSYKQCELRMEIAKNDLNQNLYSEAKVHLDKSWDICLQFDFNSIKSEVVKMLQEVYVFMENYDQAIHFAYQSKDTERSQILALYLKRAQQSLEQFNVQEAIYFLNQILSKEPDHEIALETLCLSRLKQINIHDHSPSLHALDQIQDLCQQHHFLKNKPFYKEFKTMYLKHKINIADSMYNEQKYWPLITLLLNCQIQDDINQFSPDILNKINLLLARAYFQLDHFQNAIYHFQLLQSSRLESNEYQDIYCQAILKMSDQLLLEKEFIGALNLLELSEEIFKTWPDLTHIYEEIFRNNTIEAYFKFLRSLINRDDISAINNEFITVKNREPFCYSPKILKEFLNFYLNHGLFNQAIYALDALELIGNDCEISRSSCYLQWGMYYLEKHQYPLAIKSLTTAKNVLENDEHEISKSITFSLAEAYGQLSAHDKVISILTPTLRTLAPDSDNVLSFQLYAKSLENTNNTTQAIEIYKQILGGQNLVQNSLYIEKILSLTHQLGRISFQEKDIGKSMAYFEDIVTIYEKYEPQIESNQRYLLDACQCLLFYYLEDRETYRSQLQRIEKIKGHYLSSG